MGLNDIPFMAVTVSALFVHIIAGNVAYFLEPERKGDTLLNTWWGPAVSVRLFTIRRSDVKRPVTWAFIRISRIALTIGALSFVLDLFIN